MSEEPNAQPESPKSPDIDAIAADLASLKQDFVSLMSHAKSGAFSGAAATADCSAKSVVRQVEEHPLATLLLVFAAGFCASQLMSR
jgi:hypothetical protein